MKNMSANWTVALHANWYVWMYTSVHFSATCELQHELLGEVPHCSVNWFDLQSADWRWLHNTTEHVSISHPEAHYCPVCIQMEKGCRKPRSNAVQFAAVWAVLCSQQSQLEHDDSPGNGLVSVSGKGVFCLLTKPWVKNGCLIWAKSLGIVNLLTLWKDSLSFSVKEERTKCADRERKQ